GQAALDRGNGRLDVLRGRVDVAIKGELQGDLRAAQRADGCHRIDAGDGGKLFFQRRGHGRGHRLRRGAGQAGIDHDGGKIDVGQVADREEPVGHDAEDAQRRGQQRGHDRPTDAELGQIHGAQESVLAAATAVSGRTSIFAPGARRSCPSVTTVSPSFSPSAMMVRLPAVRATLTSRNVTVWSGPTTKTCGPFWPFCTAGAGTTTTFSSTPSWVSTLTSSPGQSSWPVLSKTALSKTVPVEGSTLLSMKASVPSAFLAVKSVPTAVTAILSPVCSACRTRSR